MLSHDIYRQRPSLSPHSSFHLTLSSPYKLTNKLRLTLSSINPTAKDRLLFFKSTFKPLYRDIHMTTLGGIRDSKHGAENSVEIQDLARFAVDEHNKKENKLLELARVVKAKEQVVAGTLHHLTLEVVESGNKKLYEAKVWVKPWLNFKELQEFIHVPHFTSSDLGARTGEPEGGWREVPTHDPEVQIAADHAVKTIQQRSNSLAPYVLQEILHAKAEVNEGLAKFDMVLSVKRGSNEEKYKVLVHKNDEGAFHLNLSELKLNVPQNVA